MKIAEKNNALRLISMKDSSMHIMTIFLAYNAEETIKDNVDMVATEKAWSCFEGQMIASLNFKFFDT